MIDPETQNYVNQRIRESQNKSQFSAGPVPFHIHNGTDSPLISTSQTIYEEIAVPVLGTTVSYVFGSQKAPFAGIIKGLFAVSAGTQGTAVLWATTAGTIATLGYSAMGGSFSAPSTIVTATILAGDTVKLTPTAGSATFYIAFQTAIKVASN